MYRIALKSELAPKIKLMEIEVPRIAIKAMPGQFVIIRNDEFGERFPITIAGTDKEKGTIRLVFNEVGKSSKQLGNLSEGEGIQNVVGPLGKPSEIKNFGTVLCFGGGVLVPALHYLVQALREAGNEIIGVIGARKKDLLIFRDEMEGVSSELHITTDDGSEGNQGLDFIRYILDNK